jgi:segregation and condensation protein A
MVIEGEVLDEVVADAPIGELDLGYQVAIDAFSGPMDLLLYLVRRAQVDIADIPIATIADQFVETIGAWQRLDLDTAGDFILMAATLLEIKSRMIAPPPKTSDDQDADDDSFDLDPRAGLIQQLLAYRRFKEAMGFLDLLEVDAVQRIGRGWREAIPEDPDEADGLTLDNADPYALFDAYEIINAKVAGLGPRTVIYDDEPIEARMATVATTLQAVTTTTLRSLLQPLGHRVQRAGMVIAVLECTRQRIVTVDQLEQFGDITIRFRPESDRAIATEPLPPENTEEAPRKRRRKPPLMTWHAPAESVSEAPADETGDDAEPEDPVVETDEQRFQRELEESCRLEAVLATGADLEAAFQAFLAEREAAALAAAEAAQAIEAAQTDEPVNEEQPEGATVEVADPMPLAANEDLLSDQRGSDDGGPRFTGGD